MYEKRGEPSLNYELCQYGRSKLQFRGPARNLVGRYVAFLGGTETYGKFIRQPFPELVEAWLDVPCVNLGWPNAGIDVFLHDPEILSAASRACVTVLQVPGAQNMSNRFYSVHPRRNDRFVQASPALRALFAGVDFAEFHFTRHLLGYLAQVSPAGFAVVRAELQTAWIARMKRLLAQIDAPVVLLWMSRHAPPERADDPGLAQDPSFVTRAMLCAVEGQVVSIVDATASRAVLAAGTKGMVHPEFDAIAASKLPGPVAHQEAAEALAPVLAQYLAD